jgi:hypothetical protein
MQDAQEIQALKRSDPIWQRLRVERVRKLLFLVFLLVYIVYFGGTYWKTSGLSSIFLLFFISFGIVSDVINQLRSERYWKRIGQQRIEVMRHTQPFFPSQQPASFADPLPLPATLSLRWNRALLITVGLLFLVLVLGISIALLQSLFQKSDVSAPFTLLGILLAVLLFMVVFSYFLFFRYQLQTIEITEEGIKTRYMRQERFLRWNEALIFATYGARGINKSSLERTYEIANEREVVRWSQQMAMNFFLRASSSVDEKEDWNWLLGRVNAMVTMRTGLPLLNLGDNVQSQWLRGQSPRVDTFTPERENTSASTAPASPIAQDDPLAQRLQFNGEVRGGIVFIGLLSVVAIVSGILGKLMGNIQPMNALSGGFGNFLLVMGFLLLALMLAMSVIILLAQRYWRRIGRLRLAALQQPQLFQASLQPSAHAELPQPASIRLRTSRVWVWTIGFVEGFIVWFLVGVAVFKLSLLSSMISSLVFGLLMSSFISMLNSRVGEQRIEVTPEGIKTRFANVDSYLNWWDARLFARYTGQGLFNRPTRTQTYELASEHMVVRLPRLQSRLQMYTTEPKMSREELERWLNNLQGYMVERTGLTLMDLDTPVQT